MPLEIAIITLFPKMFDALRYGVIGRALLQNRIILTCWNPRDYTTDVHHTVDDRPYGGGPGMVLKFPPLHAAIIAAKNALGSETPVVLFSPQGEKLTQTILQTHTRYTRIILIAGRYEGIDERLITADVDETWSVGDYVVSGGELPIMIWIDAVTRLLPGTLGHKESAAQDSFSAGLLDYPHYTRPEIIDGQNVPKVLLSGDHAEIARWRLKQALGRTWKHRQDLLQKRILTETERRLLDEYIDESA